MCAAQVVGHARDFHSVDQLFLLNPHHVHRHRACHKPDAPSCALWTSAGRSITFFDFMTRFINIVPIPPMFNFDSLSRPAPFGIIEHPVEQAFCDGGPFGFLIVRSVKFFRNSA